MPLKKEKMKPLLALILTLGFLSLIGALVFIEVPLGNRDILNLIIGALTVVLIDVFSSYFKKPEA